MGVVLCRMFAVAPSGLYIGITITVSCSRIWLRLGAPAARQVLEDLEDSLGAVQLVPVDPRLEPEDVGAVADCGVEKLPPLAGEAGARDLDLSPGSTPRSSRGCWTTSA